MALLSKIAYRIQIVTHIIENPKLLLLKRKGGSINKFISLISPGLNHLTLEL